MMYHIYRVSILCNQRRQGPAEGGAVDAIIYENPNLQPDWAAGHTGLVERGNPKTVPEGVKRFADGDALNEVKAAKDLACVDIVIATRLPSGEAAVLLSRRRATDPFSGRWWIYGGSLGAYQPISQFIALRAERECGVVPVEPQALIGVYRTCAPEFIQSTLQPCYATLVPHEAIAAKMRTDPNHDSVRLFTEEGLNTMPREERHWYPLRVTRQVLENMP